MDQLVTQQNQIMQTNMTWSTDQLQLVKDTICIGSTDDEFKLFMHVVKRTGLDPFARQIYGIKRWNAQLRRETMGTQVSIDGMRLVALRSGQYGGQVGPYWCDKDGKWADVWLGEGFPKAAKVGVIRNDFKEVMWAVALFDNYAPMTKNGITAMWKKMGALMVAKCAEALALRKAFPYELSGLYTTEEMNQAPNDKPAPTSKPPQQPPAQQQHKLVYKDNKYIMDFGQYKNKSFDDVEYEDLLDYIDFIKKGVQETGKPPRPQLATFLNKADKYVRAVEQAVK